MPSHPLRDRTAIVGVGYTEFSKNSGKTTLGLALEACYKAIGDAGLEVTDIDGVATYAVGDSTLSYVVADALGIEDTAYFLDHLGGGSASQSTIAAAAMAVHSGVATNVLCYRALNSRSGFRMGGTGREPRTAGDAQYQSPYGHLAPGQAVAMGARMHMERYGTTKDQLGAVAVTFRQHASMNERALMRTPITLDDYHASRMISDPLQLLDFCLESDGACAFVITSAERARDLPQPPVYVSGVGYGPGRTLYSKAWMDPTESGARFMAPRLFGMAGVTPADIDVACIYDAFTYMVVVQMEDLGFCKLGEGADYVGGGRLGLGGEFPTNLDGGLLSHSHNGNPSGLHLIEVVRQLRGEVEPERQVEDPKIGFVHGQGAAVLGRHGSCVLAID